MIEYTVRISDPHAHKAHVLIEFDASDDVEMQLPSWTPGSYLLREFGRYAGEVDADDGDGERMRVTKTAKSTWKVHVPSPTRLRIGFDAYCHELTVRTPHIDGTHAFFVGTNLLPMIVGRADEELMLRIECPDDWTVFCPLESKDDGWLAENYDILADTAVECGPHRSHELDIEGVPHRLIFWGDDRVRIDVPKLAEDVARIVEANAALFGGLPYERYDFVFHITATHRGGLEHLSSTTLATPWRYFDNEDDYLEMLGLIAHEHFHVWNGKRIRPSELGPFDYVNENYTRALWIVEGWTSYFDELQCVRAGVSTRERYLKEMGKSIDKLLAVPGRFEQSLAESSFDSWIRLYRPDENTNNRTVSYYLKGSIVGCMLDLSIRQQTSGERSLDDVMRKLWALYRADGAGYDEAAIAEIALDSTGVDIRPLLEKWVYGTADPDYRSILATHGILFSHAANEVPYFGLEFENGGSFPTVARVLADGPGAGGELYPGDEIVAIDRRRATPANIISLLKRCPTDEPVTTHVLRRNELVKIRIRSSAPRPGKVQLEVDSNLRGSARRLLDAWLPS